jgi:hypothetical protein
MRLPKKIYIIPVCMITLVGIAAAPVSGAFFIPKVEAFQLPDVLAPIKDFFSNPPPKVLTIEPSIGLAPDGDVNKNGQIDSGDSITFAYKITNLTDTSYSYATLKTALPRKQLNFIRNLNGATGIKDTSDSITIPNLRIPGNSEQIISFDARINYTKSDDIPINTTAELLDSGGASLFKSTKKEVIAKKLSVDEYQKFVKSSVKKGESNAQ